MDDPCTTTGCTDPRSAHFPSGDTLPCSKCICTNYTDPDGLRTAGDNPFIVTAANFTHQLARFVLLAQIERKLKSDLETVTAAKERLDEPLREQMAELGMQNTRINGLTVYVNRQLWAGAAKVEVVQPDGSVAIVSDRQTTCDALIESGQAQFVEPGFNTNTVSAWIRELPQDDQGMPILPPELVGRISVTERYQLRTRK